MFERVSGRVRQLREWRKLDIRTGCGGDSRGFEKGEFEEIDLEKGRRISICNFRESRHFHG